MYFGLDGSSTAVPVATTLFPVDADDGTRDVDAELEAWPSTHLLTQSGFEELLALYSRLVDSMETGTFEVRALPYTPLRRTTPA